MKNLVALVAVLFLGGLSGSVLAQGRKEVKEIKSIKKEVRLEENNGEKTLKIVTDENGKKTEEVYKGKEAEEKMKELETTKNASSASKKVEVRTVTNEKVQETEKQTKENVSREPVKKKVQTREKAPAKVMNSRKM